MKVKISFKSFLQKTAGIPFILLYANIQCILAVIHRPDARWIVLLVLGFVDMLSAYAIGRVCRSYIIYKDGVTAVWLGLFRRRYSWDSFCSVSRETICLGYRTASRVLCSQIPLNRRHDGMVDKEFLARHPFRVLDIDMTEEQLSEFSKYYPIQL